jgi:FkbM family methyltransferase
MLPQVNIIRAKNADFLSFYERAGISGVLTAHGVWDELTINIAKNLINISTKNPNILDIGANMGTFSIPIAEHIIKRNGTIHCFEPQRIIYYQLCGNIFLNRLDNAYTHNIALSTENAQKEINTLDYHQAWNIGAFSLIPGIDTQEITTIKEFCQFLKLDDFNINQPITLIKLDVEGMELEVLTGGMLKIQTDGFPPILFESRKNDHRTDLVFKLLKDIGYKFTQYADEDWLAQHPLWDTELGINISDNILNFIKLR